MKNFIFLFSLLFCLTGCAQNPNTNRDIDNIKKAYKALENHDWEAFKKYCVSDFEELNLGSDPVKGVDNALEQYKAFFTAFPDLKFSIQNIVPAGNNTYYLNIELSGTNTGSFMGFPATGKNVKTMDMDIVVLNNQGLCVSHRATNPNQLLYDVGLAFLANPNTQTVFGIYQQFGAGNFKAIADACDANVNWDARDNQVFEKGGRIYTGSADVLNFFGDVGKRSQVTKFVPVRVWADGNDVAVRIKCEFNYTNLSDKYEFELFHHFNFKDGKIADFKETSTKPRKI